MAFLTSFRKEMTRKKGPWTVQETVEKYRNAYFSVLEETVRTPEDKPGTFSTILLKPGISVLALDEHQNVYLTKEYRYAIERDSIEVVSGGVDENESTLACARRELREEAGIEAHDWLSLGVVDPLTSILRSPAELFLARNLTFVEPQTEETEIIELIKTSLHDSVGMVMDGQITHAPSCVLILKAYVLLTSS